MSGARELAEAITQRAAKVAQSSGSGGPQVAIVQSCDPLAAELTQHRHTLVEGEDFVLAQWVRKYDLDWGIEEGDSLVLLEISEGDYVAIDVESTLTNLLTPGVGGVLVYEQPGQPSPDPPIGAMWIDTDATPGTWVPSIPLVTTLPDSPLDGQEVYYDVGNGFVWHLRYRATSASAYKWEFIGGPPLVATTDLDEGSGGGVSPHTSPLLTIPRSGDYLLGFNNSVNGSPTPSLQVRWATQLLADSTSLGEPFYDSYWYVSAASGSPIYRQTLNLVPTLKTGLSAGSVIKMQPYVTNWDYNSYARTLSALPVRVS